MIFPYLKNKPVFYTILSGFAIMVFVELSLLNSALKGKEKDFNDRLFYISSAYAGNLVKDTALMNEFTGDNSAIGLLQTRIKKQIDSLYLKNEIPLNYVFAVGKYKQLISPDPGLTIPQKSWGGNNLIWSSDTANNAGLISTKLRLPNLGPPGSQAYYVKIFFPSKSSYLFKELLPLIIVTALTLVILFFCFLILVSIIKKQTRLAEVKNDFISNMTHELKTPLFTISIASKMLSEQELIKENKKYGSYIETIQQETGRLVKLVDTLLQTATLTKKQLQADKKEIDVHNLIRLAVQHLDLIRQEQKATIELALHAKEHYILADQTQMEGVIYSLVDNAFKYANGPAHITVSSLNKDNHIMISFLDKGIGMDIETKGLIFERFFRAHTGNLHDVKGYGIGLSYVKTVIDAHDGSVTVKSTPGKGSEFILLLPCIHYGS